jgi:hypothetical protein
MTPVLDWETRVIISEFGGSISVFQSLCGCTAACVTVICCARPFSFLAGFMYFSDDLRKVTRRYSRTLNLLSPKSKLEFPSQTSPKAESSDDPGVATFILKHSMMKIKQGKFLALVRFTTK